MSTKQSKRLLQEANRRIQDVLVRRGPHLSLRAMELRSLPPAVLQLTWLETLDLADNRLASLPEGIAILTELRSLDLSNNRLVTLPDGIAQLGQLQSLDVRSNRLESLPEGLIRLARLEDVYLDGNDGLGLPPELLKPTNPGGGLHRGRSSDRSAILRYYFRMRKGPTESLNEAKLLLLGQGGVGKTSLVRRLHGEPFDEREAKTDGIAITQLAVPVARGPGQQPEHVRLNVWDFGGQEIMHATHQFFLTRRSVYLVVLDARKGENEGNIHYWLKIIQSYGGDSPILVVINKAESHLLDINETRLRLDYAPNLRGVVRVSCATGAGLGELRSCIIDQIATLPHVFDDVPVSYFAVKEKLATLARDRNFIDIDEFEGTCRAEGIAERHDQEVLLRFLHDLGTVLNFHDPESPYALRETSILNPEWVTGGVYTILNSNSLMQEQGRLDVSRLATILGDAARYPPDRHRFIVDMMRKFELCFEYPDSNGQRLLIPELLSKNEPDLGWDSAAALNFEYHYNVLPGGIICRFIVKMHHNLTEKPTYWRSGVVLDIDGNRALIRADGERRRIYISVFGPQAGRRRALAVIRDRFKEIHKTIPKIGVQEKVPLQDEPAVAVDYQHLARLEQMGTDRFLPEGAAKLYRVRDLLDGIEEKRRFDVFVSHNSTDKPAVREFSLGLKARGLAVWLDEWEIPPGSSWMEALEQVIQTARSAVVLIGRDGLRPWVVPEMRACLNEFVTRNMRVIPVLLPGAPAEPELPLFMMQLHWVDFRDGITREGMDKIEWGITGKKPRRDGAGGSEDKPDGVPVSGDEFLTDEAST